MLSYNDFRYRDHSDEAKIEYRPFQPFSAVPDEGAALYLGWNGKLPNDPVSLYVQLADVRRAQLERAPRREFLRDYYAERDAVWEAEQRVVWEYFDGGRLVAAGRHRRHASNFTASRLPRLRRRPTTREDA